MFRERERFEKEEIGKRIKREIDASKSMVASNNCYDNNNNNNNHQIVGRRSHMMGVGPPPHLGTTLNTITPCAACKLLRRRCAEECPFSPYFSPHEPQKFAAVHKVFGASNVSKLLMEVPDNQRADAANSLVYEANVRLRDPVYGCMGAISALQQQVQTLQAELNAVRAEILKYKYREAANNLISATNNATNHPHHHHNHHNNNNNSLVTSVAAAVIAASLPQQVQSPPHQPQSQPQRASTPPPPATPPPPSSASVVVSSSPSGGAASLYTPPPPPPPDHSVTNTGFSSISTNNHSSVPYFD